MMKKIYFLLFVLFGLNLQGQIVNIPDANFKAKLLSANSTNTIAKDLAGNYFKIDVNNDGEIQESEALQVLYLAIASSSIASLEGIQFFTGLQYLYCRDNQLLSLNASMLTNLQYLDCQNNQLLSLNLSGLTNLQTLFCNNNQLHSLDVSGLTNLKYLYSSSNYLTSLNIGGLTNLQTLKFEYNQLTSLNVSELTNLQYLDCQNNQLTSLNVSGLTNLYYLNCKTNQLTSLNVSGLTNLQYLDCRSNQLTSLNASGLTNLETLHCQSNQLASLNASGLTNLKYLYSSSNYLTSLNASELTNLQSLNCSDNLLSTLLIKNNNISWINNANGINGDGLLFYNNPNLQYICADDEDIAMVQQKIVDYGYSNCHVNSYCSFTPGGTFYDIIGNTKYDFNSNGCDISDINYSNLRFNQTVSNNLVGVYVVNQSGNYSIPVQAGLHTIAPNLENPSYFNISPTNISVDFPTQASPFIQDFCVTANGVHSDVEVVVLPTVPARSGFDAKYKIIYRNKGNQVENGAITFTYAATVLDYVFGNPVYDSQTTDSFIWNYTNLEPLETREIEVVFNVNSPIETPAVNIGDQLNFTAQITPMVNDEVLYDNTSAIKQTVVGSYDPNDKTCLEGETVGPDMIGEYVHYLIRFENTGTYPAENVVVKDMIDLAKFDLATLIPLKGSHDFYTRIKDNKVEFIFENINLDFNDATNDGYVAFKIKTKSNLTVGSTFSNNANIYFDYNFPITTNTYTTTIQALNLQDFVFSNQFTLYPNPAKEVLNFQSKENLNIQSVEIYNMLGQIVISVPNATTSIDVSSLKSGNYFVKVNTEKGSANTKFVKE